MHCIYATSSIVPRVTYQAWYNTHTHFKKKKKVQLYQNIKLGVRAQYRYSNFEHTH